MKSVKKKIHSIISSLLISSPFVSPNPKVNAFDEYDEYDEYCDYETNDENLDDELDDEQQTEEREMWERGVDLIKNNPWKTGLSLWGVYSFCKGTKKIYDVLKKPQESLNLLLDVIIKKSSDERYSLVSNFKEVSSYEKCKILEEAYTFLSDRMLSISTTALLKNTSGSINQVKNASSYLFSSLYASVYGINTDLLARKTIKDKRFLTCVEVSLILSELCKRIGYVAIVRRARDGHVSLIYPKVQEDNSCYMAVLDPVYKQSGTTPKPIALFGYNSDDVLFVRKLNGGFSMYRCIRKTWVKDLTTGCPVGANWLANAINDSLGMMNGNLDNISSNECIIKIPENDVKSCCDYVSQWVRNLIQSFDASPA